MIKEIVYEESTRRMLDRQQVASPKPTAWWKYTAAAVVIAILALVTFTYMGDDHSEDLIVDRYYEFPLISKSRGAESHIIDQYLTELRAEEYQNVLDQLEGKQLSEKDTYAKVNLLIATGSIDEAEKLIRETRWQDEYYQAEIRWLQFLIAASRQSPDLRDMIQDLPKHYQDQANAIMKEWK